MSQSKGPVRKQSKTADRRAAILAAAGTVFFDKGFDAATTLEIATMARVSKRDLYECFSSKHEMLSEIIKSRSREMQKPVQIPAPASREEFFATLEMFGVTFLRQLLHPDTIGLYRLAIAGRDQSGVIGQELKLAGQVAVVATLKEYISGAVAQGYFQSFDVDLGLETYFSVLIGNLQMSQLLRTAPLPTLSTLRERAARAVKVLALLAG